jgi:hypothetical protein
MRPTWRKSSVLRLSRRPPHRAAVVFLIDNVGETYLRFYGATRTELAGALFRTATAVAAWDDEG